jgi:thymidylate kinase
MVFVGINGVGKSTSLSKVCYYLKSHGLKVRQATIVSAIGDTNRENPMGGQCLTRQCPSPSSMFVILPAGDDCGV